ncbi:MAG: histone deacetylase family protein [Pseudomonadota bacterium]
MLVFTHMACAEHRPPLGHPECPERLAAALSGLDGVDAEQREAPLADWDRIALAHGAEQIEQIKSAALEEGLVHIDPDTALSDGSLEAALRAAGAGVAAVDAVAGGEAAHAFCAVRPPGHHAEPDRSMGFCVFNTAAIAAYHAREAHGLERVAVVDFDVHHGNGTQAAFWNDPLAFYGSSHQWPFYPGTGSAEERGAHGNVANAPLASGAEGAAFRAQFEREILWALDAFEPDIVVISAGFDGHAHDPLGGLRLSEADFAWASDRLCDVAERRSQGRVVSVLEGGYDLPALAGCVRAHVAALAGSAGA